jgi:hypothetical protein
MGCREAALGRRFYYGFTAREGGRKNAFRKLRVRNIAAGMLREDTNKTDEPRLAALEQDVALAIDLYLRWYRPDAKPGDYLFTTNGRPLPEKMTEAFHADLKLAGGMREALFEDSDTRKPIRVYDLRATFVTIRLANRWSTSDVKDKTGHKSVQMIERYNRDGGPVRALKARSKGLRDFVPLYLAIPELAIAGAIEAVESLARALAAEHGSGGKSGANRGEPEPIGPDAAPIAAKPAEAFDWSLVSNPLVGGSNPSGRAAGIVPSARCSRARRSVERNTRKARNIVIH